MANKDAPFGFRSVGKKGGGVANGGVTEYSIASGATGDIFSGDPVKMLNTGTILVAGAATTLLGIFRGCKFTNSSGEVIFSSHFSTTTASSDIVAFVEDDPDTLFEIFALGVVSEGKGTPQQRGFQSLNTFLADNYNTPAATEVPDKKYKPEEAITNLALNTRNRNSTIKNYNYGP